MTIAVRDHLGVTRLFVDAAGERWSRTLAPLLPPAPTLDPDGVRFAWGIASDASRTCFAEARPVPAGHALVALSPPRHEPVRAAPPSRSLKDALVHAVGAIEDDAVLALSGGFDSAFVLALFRAAGRDLPPILSLRTPWPAYDERDLVAETAEHFGLRPAYVDVGPDEVLEAIDPAVAAAETCLFNLHPVARGLLAREAARRGFRALVTGDGADQLFAGAPSEIFLPILGALVADTGVALRSPFLDPEVGRHAADAGGARRGDGKATLRAIARDLAGDAPWIDREKTPRWFPQLDLEARIDRAFVTRVGLRFALPTRLDRDRDRVGWVTLQSLVRRFGVSRCAE